MKLQHNKILITGATAGIGKALTEKFIALGNEVIAVGRNQRKLDELGELSTSVIPFRFKLITLLLPVLNAHSNAAIVNVSSGLGLVPKMSAPVYCGTKAGIHIFTKSLRYQLDKIKVFEVLPPLVATDMTAGRGKGKISPEQLVDEFIRGFAKDKLEMNIGKVKLLKRINRLVPRLAEKIMKGK